MLFIGNILQQFYNTIDAFVVGRYAGTEEFAAIDIAGTVMNLFLFLIVGCCTGLSVLFARYNGTKDNKMLRRQHFTALFAGILFSATLHTWTSLHARAAGPDPDTGGTSVLHLTVPVLDLLKSARSIFI